MARKEKWRHARKPQGGLERGGAERLSRGYAYNSFGDITSLTEGTTSNSFTYDGLGRLASAYDDANRLSSFNGQTYGDSGPFHAVDRIGNADRFDYDAKGNMTVRNKGLASQQTLVWDDEDRLSQVQNSQAPAARIDTRQNGNSSPKAPSHDQF